MARKNFSVRLQRLLGVRRVLHIYPDKLVIFFGSFYDPGQVRDVEGRVCGKPKLRWFNRDRAVYFLCLDTIEKLEILFGVALDQLLVGSVFSQSVEDYSELSVIRVVGNFDRIIKRVSCYPSLCDSIEKSFS